MGWRRPPHHRNAWLEHGFAVAGRMGSGLVSCTKSNEAKVAQYSRSDPMIPRSPPASAGRGTESGVDRTAPDCPRARIPSAARIYGEGPSISAAAGAVAAFVLPVAVADPAAGADAAAATAAALGTSVA